MINPIFIKFKVDNSILVFIINNIFFRDLIKHFLIIEFNNLFNSTENKLI